MRVNSSGLFKGSVIDGIPIDRRRPITLGQTAVKYSTVNSVPVDFRGVSRAPRCFLDQPQTSRPAPAPHVAASLPPVLQRF